MTIFRKIILILSLFIAGQIFSQEKNIGLTLQLSNPINDVQAGWFNIDGESFDGYNVKDKSFSTGLTLQYYLSDQTQLRLRTGVTKINITEYGSYSGVTGFFDTISVNGKQTKIHLAPGLIWNTTKEKFTFSGGFEILYNLQQKYVLTAWSKTVDLTTGTVTEFSGTATVPKGFSIGLGAIMGFNYSFSNWFSLGAEFSPSIFYYSLGGEIVYITSSDPTYYGQDKNEGLTGFENRFSINLTFNIWKKNKTLQLIK